MCIRRPNYHAQTSQKSIVHDGIRICAASSKKRISCLHSVSTSTKLEIDITAHPKVWTNPLSQRCPKKDVVYNKYTPAYYKKTKTKNADEIEQFDGRRMKHYMK